VPVEIGFFLPGGTLPVYAVRYADARHTIVTKAKTLAIQVMWP